MVKRIIAAAILASVLLSAVSPAAALAASADTVVISSAEGLRALSKSCSLDVWSQGRTVVLEADIDLSRSGFSPIPIFCGTFDGQGHTIKGLSINGTTGRGLFNIVGDGAVVRGLNVVGVVAPTGSEGNIGGIVGTNNGRLEDCSFSGIVRGGAGVGGIAGENLTDGELIGCSVSGTVDGEQSVGGIAGTNSGSVSQCINEAAVNTTNEEKTQSLEDLELSLPLDLGKLDLGGSVASSTDVGGITGYSAGMVLNCTNRGNIGYPHVGYNIGGIAGRSSGFISFCANEGELNGRKDVGGVAGQLEPYLVLSITQSSLDTLSTRLNDLSVMVNSALDNARGSSSEITGRLESISAHLSEAVSTTQLLTEHIGAYGESAVAEIDRGSIIIYDALLQLSVIAAQVPQVAETLTLGTDRLSEAFDSFEDAGALGAQSLASLELAAGDMKTAVKLMESGGSSLISGISRLPEVISVADGQAVGQALNKISAGLSDFQKATELLGSALKKVGEIINDKGIFNSEVRQAVADAAASLAEAASALVTITGGVGKILDNLNFDSNNLKIGLFLIESGSSTLSAAAASLYKAFDSAEDALGIMSAASGGLSEGMGRTAEAFEMFSAASGQLKNIAGDMAAMFSYLANADPVQFGQPDGEIKKNSGELFSVVSVISGELGELGGEMSSASGALIEDLRRLNSQSTLVINSLIDMVHEQESADISDIYSDTSDEDIDAVTSGKTYRCDNYGEVRGDLNVGGIVGLMAIEYGYDPEDDVMQTDSFILNRRYETKAIVQESRNYGTVTSKKNYAGCIAGQMNLGIITGCGGYGRAASESGDYVGGIAGKSSSKIRDCFVKAELSGRDYVAGAAGSGGWIAGCYTMVKIDECASFYGAVSGNCDGTFSSNYFVSDTLAGINQVSYAGKAEPVEYSAMLAVEKLPDEFKSFSLCFTVDGEVIKALSFDYGASFGGEVYPELPDREGYYAYWDGEELSNLRFDTEVRAVYAKLVTALVSEQRRGGTAPVFLAEGSFAGNDRLDAVLEGSGSDCLESYPDLYEASAGSLFEVVNSSGCERWRLSVSDDGSQTHTIRYKPDSGISGNIKLFLDTGDGWKKAGYTEEGSYLVFKIDGCDAELIAVPTQNKLGTVLLCAVPLVLFAVVITALVKRRGNVA